MLGQFPRVDSADDVFVANKQKAGLLNAFIKYAGANGAELWRYAVGGDQFPIVDVGSGDVFNWIYSVSPNIVVKLSGANGMELWPQPLTFADFLSDIVVDRWGDLFLTGRSSVVMAPDAGFVAKLSGSTGGELWRQTWANAGQLNWLALDGAGDVIACCKPLIGGVGAVKLSSATGAELWSQFPALLSFRMYEHAVDHLGDVVLVGDFGAGSNLVKISGADGTEIWRRTALPRLGAPAVDNVGDVIAVDGSGKVVKLNGADGTDFLPCGGPCATGPELALLIPVLAWARRRRSRIGV